jgi:ribosomal protein L31E
MSQEHLLKLAYDAVLKRQQQKSSYRTLSESYKAVYEAEGDQPVTHPEQGTPINIEAPVEVPSVTQADVPVAEPSVSGTEVRWDKNTVYAGERVEWVGLQKEIYNKRPTGIGPGEFSVASVISGSVDENVLASMISGQGESYDVSYPKADDKNADRYEVKMEGDVRVGVKGADLGKKVVTTVESALTHIIEEYEILNPADKEALNAIILKKVKLKELKEPEVVKGVSGKELIGSVRSREKHQAALAAREEKKKGWDIYGYAKAILDNISELPLEMIYGSEYEYSHSKESENVAARNKYLIASLLTVLEAIEDVHGVINVNRFDREEKDPESVRAIKNTLQRYYGAKDVERAEELNNAIDVQAHKVDRALTLTKVKVTKEGGSTYSEFAKAIKKLKFADKIKELKDTLEDGEKIRNLFPDKESKVKIAGLFVVSEKGWRYLPEDKIKDYVEVTTISQGKPKIKVKYTSKNES